ncbi:MAG: hypothetical protein HOB69_09695 [Flavobacterium sp.]|jgi:hypothetical protein|nr:hypothetical protein [Flavobacterium sp.]
MKNLICVFFVFFMCFLNAQDLTLMHVNAKWNQSNNYNLRGVKNCKIQYALLEDQAPSLRAQITSVPIIILLDKNGKPRGQWKAGLSFKIDVPVEEIQNRVNVIMLETNRRRATSN